MKNLDNFSLPFCSSNIFVDFNKNTTFLQALTPCLTFILLPLIQFILSFTCLCFLFIYGNLVISPKLELTKILVFKLFLGFFSSICCFVRIIIFNFGLFNFDQEEKIGSIFDFVSIFCLFLSELWRWKKGILSSIWVHLSLFIRIFFVLSQTYFILNFDDNNPVSLFSLTFEAESVAIIIFVFVYCIVDKHPENYENFDASKKICPDKTISTIGRSFFSYASELMSKGYREKLTYDSTWSLDKSTQPEHVLSIFYTKLPSYEARKPIKHWIPWLFISLMKSTGFYVIAGMTTSWIFAIIVLADPIFLKLVTDSVEKNYPLWFGIGLVVFVFLVTVARFVLSVRSDFYSLMGYLNVQSILMNVIYQKALKLSSTSRVKYSAGEVVNLLSTDLERIRHFWYMLEDYAYAPFMVISCFIGLELMIGHNAFYGLIIIFAFIPMNSIVIKFLSKAEQKQMEYKDSRLKLMTDILSGMKILKLYAWEESMRKRVAIIRAKEVQQFRNAAIYYAILESTFSLCPVVATVASFFGYIVIDGKQMTPQVAFISLMLFNLMRFSVYIFPDLVKEAINARVSLLRLEEFLYEAEVPTKINNIEVDNDEIMIQMENCTFSWGEVEKNELESTGNGMEPVGNGVESIVNGVNSDQERLISMEDDTESQQNQPKNDSGIYPLHKLTLKVKKGELIGIVGRVGAGKSSFLSAIAGELNRKEGNFFRRNVKMAYVSQEPWIQNMTFKDNILFGKLINEELYRKTIDSCALREDLKQFIAGDMTEIGERGLNLSGGQKARVALARAVYQDSDLYLLDDTLSAVDSHVGNHIFQHVIGNDGILKDKTRIFALNSISFLSRCDRIVVMKEGKILDIGTYDELKLKGNSTFDELIKELEIKQDQEDSEITEKEIEEMDDVLNELIGSPSPTKDLRRRTTSTDSGEIPNIISRQISSSSTHSNPPQFLRLNSQITVTDGRLIEEEELAIGKVGFKMYYDYAKAFGLVLFGIYGLSMFLIRTSLESSSQVWLSKWSATVNATKSDEMFGLEIYAGLSIASGLFVGVATSIIAFGSYRASKKLHDSFLFSLLRSPMNFFDTTPMGRILNRLSKDIERIDSDVPSKLSGMVILSADVVMYVASSVFVMPLLGVFTVPVMIAFVLVVRYYTHTSVQLRRLCSKSWSAVTSHLQDSYVGVNYIRAYGVQNRFERQMMNLGIVAVECNLLEIVSNRWIQLRMDILTTIFSSILTLCAIYLGHIGTLSTGSVALITSTGTMLRGLLGWIARSIKDLEQSIVAVERIQEYIDNKHEAEWKSKNPPRLTWPENGELIFKNFSLKYRPTTPLVLKNLNIKIPAGQKVGIVGRTGAGKTSLTMALFRMIEPSSGTIYIDGIDFKTIGLHELRQSLTIIPQDPILFCGTLRANLDPFEEFNDEILWETIEKSHLKKFVNEFPEKLNHEIGEGGTNLSIGQRQLICLARAILRKKTKILILDEATAAVDVETDQLIQNSIRNLFKNVTILTIAHRLNTIMDYDKIMVMDSGEIREFESPKKLLDDKNSLFYGLAAQAKLV